MAEPAICKKRSGAPSPGGHSALPRHYRLRVPFFDTFTFCTPGISFNLAAPARMSACETRTSRMVVSSRSSSTLWTSRGCARDHGSHRRADGECSPVARRGVAISGIAEAGMICVFIDDDGPGMDAGRIDNALARGARLDEAGSGHSFGLAIVKELVDATGGTMEFDEAPIGGLRVALSWTSGS
ncbi:ATP-binding protein (plasmid) [Novosphingobium resinovorum]|nr:MULTISPECIES: ATP-binding protein [Novosphingobium]MBF7015552.1 hypothetical protein [Novosphingobium sp. HR1a]WJM30228.1 ATP-binding protein [Novosphingobium resinovorum]